MTTNGTLLRGKILSWFAARADRFEFIISYDGTPEMQDRNRIDREGEGSGRRIDLDEIIRAFPGAIAKMTIGADTFEQFADGILFLDEKGYRVKANFASGVDFDLPANRDVCKRNMLKLIDYYTAHGEKRLPFMLDLHLREILVSPALPFAYCDAGVNKSCYDNKGDCYPCQGLMPMAVSNEKFKDETFSDHNILSHSECRKCHFVRICRTCYAVNYLETGDVWTPSQQTCLLNRICMLSSARIQYNRIKQKDRESWTKEDFQTMNAVLKIARELNGVF